MKSKLFIFLALGSVSLLSADYYDRGRQSDYNRQSSCPGGNCPYQQGQQGQRQNYYPEASGQTYYRENPQYGRGYHEQDNRGYNQDNRGYQDNRGGNYDSRNNPGQDQDGYYNPSDRTTKTVSDADIKKKIDDTLTSSWLSSGYPNVTYNLNNGNIDLRGTVKNQDEKIKLENAIRKIDGIRNVNSQVMLNERSTERNDAMKNDSMRSDSYNRRDESNMRNDSSMRQGQMAAQDNAATDSDRRINEKIREKIRGWFSDNYEGIILNTNNGVVTIIGIVDSPEDLDKISKDAKDVDGVRSVNNKASIQRR